MKLAKDVVFLIFWLLIKIGDLALFVIALPVKTTRYLFTNASKHMLEKKKSSKIHAEIAKRKKQKEETIRNQKKVKPIVIFPIPFLERFRYFVVGAIFSFIFLFIPLLTLVFLQDLPNPKLIAGGQIPQTTKIYDRNNILLYQIYASENRTLVPLDTIPNNLKFATIAIEDKDFFNHIGFDSSAIIRSFFKDVSGEDFQGGSTITQQLIKSTLLTPETSIVRKFKEVILAFWAERIYTKNQILEMYFNQIAYGGTAWGVEAASEIYFGKNVKDLDLAQCAFLAGIPRAPTIYSPYGTTPTAWKKRQKEVIKRMIDLKYITKKEGDDAFAEDLTFLAPQNPLRAPHFSMYIKDLLVKKYGLPMVEKGGLTVVTTLDLKLQDMAQNIVTNEVANDAYLNLTNGASMITNPQTGDILAMVGSRDFNYPQNGNVNVTTALRQPGSSIKVITYSAALSKGFTAATILDDSPITFTFGAGSPSYTPVNYDGKFHGKIPLRIALANSLNIPAVKTLNQIGVPTMIAFGKNMGITHWNNPSNYGLSITLGGAEVTMLDMATVYGTLANSGIRADLNPFLLVKDAKGTVLEKKSDDSKNTTAFPIQKTNAQEIFPQDTTQRVLDPGVSFIMSNILADNQARAWEFGTNSPLYIPGHTVSVKTGTTDYKRDNWTIGYTKQYVVAVWVGNNDNSPMSPSLASGITGAAPIWNKIMSNLLVNSKDEPLQQPQDVVTKTCFGRTEYFIKGTENSVRCDAAAYPSISPTPKPKL